MKFQAALILIILIIAQLCAADSSTNLKLKKIIDVYAIKPCKPEASRPLYPLGKQLFESKQLAGDKDIACQDCHLDAHGLADGLPIAIGVGGHGHAQARLQDGDGILVQRNAFTLFDRGHPAFLNFFWDGKVDANQSTIYSPFGDKASRRFQSALAIAAILPITERDEFLGVSKLAGDNELRKAVGDSLYQDKYEALSVAIVRRVWSDPALAATARAAGFEAANFELADVGNALADFIAVEFSCRDTPWQHFLNGEREAINDEEKRGAVAFFGKARCAGCHAPPLFSDFKFYGIGVPQGNFGPHTRSRDIGRAAVTHRAEDLYLFRTPPLVAVTLTAPYGHNGLFPSLRSIILHHVNPISFLIDTPALLEGKDKFRLGKYLDSRADQLKFIEITSQAELDDIIHFLGTL